MSSDVEVVIELTSQITQRISGDPALYSHCPFLVPVRDSALKIHRRYRNSCSTCAREAKNKAFGAIANAMTSLIVEEAKKQPNELAAFKDVVRRILNSNADKILVRYTKDNVPGELQF